MWTVDFSIIALMWRDFGAASPFWLKASHFSNPKSPFPHFYLHLQHLLHSIHLIYHPLRITSDLSQISLPSTLRTLRLSLNSPLKSQIVLGLFIWLPDIKRYMNSCSLSPLVLSLPEASGCKSERAANCLICCVYWPSLVCPGRVLMRTRTPSPALCGLLADLTI